MGGQTPGPAATNVNVSAGTRLLTPPGVVTVTSTVPAPCTGAVAVIWPSPFTMKEAGASPNFTALAPENPDPVITTEAPPLVGPERRFSELTTGLPPT